jgi:hypothetical protein
MHSHVFHTFALMFYRISRCVSKRFTFFGTAILILIFTSSCVSLSKYRKLESDYSKSKSDCTDLIVKNSLLENDTTQYGVKYRTLQNDINYLQNTSKSENDRLVAELENQKKELSDKRVELDRVSQKFSMIQEERMKEMTFADSLNHAIMAYMFINNKHGDKLNVNLDGTAVRVKLNDADWFLKNAEGNEIIDQVASILKTDTSLNLIIERIGPGLSKNSKGLESKSDNAGIFKSIQVWNYLTDKKGINADRIKLQYRLSDNHATPESYSFLISKK